MKIVFMGTPEFAAVSLAAVLDSGRHEVLAVCTQPDKPSGRGKKIAMPPVKELALRYNLPVFQPKTLSLKHPEESKPVRAALRELNADIFVVAAYGLLLPKGVLDMPPHGCINVHASLLPKYRGASPIHAAILNNDKTTGITIMYMDVTLDTGDMILQRDLQIEDGERFPALHDRMAALGGIALLEALGQIEDGTATRVKQNESQATHCGIIKKPDGLINCDYTTEKILCMLRAYDPWPGCHAEINGQTLKIWNAEPIAEPDANSLTIKTADGLLKITEVQAEGKKRMSAADFLRGQRATAN